MGFNAGRTSGRYLALERVRKARALREAAGIQQPDTGGHLIAPIATPRAEALCRIRDKRLGRLDEHTNLERRMPHMTAGTLDATEYTGESYQSDLVPEDIYVLELLSFSEPKLSTFSPEDKPKYYLYTTFRVVESLDGDTEHAGKGFEDQAGYTLSKGPKGASKLRMWVEAFLGRPLETGEKVDLDALAAKHPKARAAVAVKSVTKGDGSVVEKSYVENMKPLKRSAKQILDGEADVPPKRDNGTTGDEPF